MDCLKPSKIQTLMKAKYIKREGTPGNYKYTYAEGQGGAATATREKGSGEKPAFSYHISDSPNSMVVAAHFHASNSYNGMEGEKGAKVPKDAKAFVSKNIAPFRIDEAAKALGAKGFKTAVFPGAYHRGHGQTYHLVAWKEGSSSKMAATAKPKSTASQKEIDDYWDSHNDQPTGIPFHQAAGGKK